MRSFKRISMILVILGLFGSLGWTGWQVFRLHTSGQILLDQGLKNLSAIIAGQGENTLDSAKLTEIFKTAITQEPRWQGLALISQDKGLYVFYGNGIKNLPVGGKILPGMAVFPVWDGQVWKQNTGMLVLNQPLGYRLEGLFDYITTSELYQMTQFMALVLAGLLGYTLLVLILTRVIPTRPKQAPFDVVAPPHSESTITTDENSKGSQEPIILDLEKMADETLAGLPDMNTPPDPFEEEYTFKAPEPEIEPAKKEDLTNEINQPQSSEGPALFSPNTSLSWASFFPKRLDYELERAAAFSQDLCLIMISSSFLVDNEVGYSETGREIGRFFVYRDLAFEYDDSTFAVVIPGQGLEKSMQQVTDFLRKLESKFPGKCFFAGVSARCGRLISHPVIVQEAMSSLVKAREGQERIVGFKADPDRYRAHLATGV